jgi:ATP-dependent exoDNAse (exonuclease V) beta subunit
MADRIIAGAVRTLTDPRGRWILSQHRESRSEYEIAGVLDGVLYRATIDRTFVDESGTRWIIDYKTSEPGDEDVESFLDREQQKYAIQMERYAALFTLIEKRPIRLGLYFPLFNGWRELTPGDDGHTATSYEPRP